jgi:DNA-binding SARP family transcriptional activator
MTVSSIVAKDSPKLRSFDRYEETLSFIASSSFNPKSEDLRKYLRESVFKRHYIVPVYEDEVDTWDALVSAEEYFNCDCSREDAQKRIFGFYLLIEAYSNNKERVNIALIEAFRRLKKSSSLALEEGCASESCG